MLTHCFGTDKRKPGLTCLRELPMRRSKTSRLRSRRTIRATGCPAGPSCLKAIRGSEGDGIVEIVSGSRSGRRARFAFVQHRQLAPILPEHDLRRVALLAALSVPFYGSVMRHRDKPLSPCAVLLGDVSEPLVEDHNAVPFGALLALPRPRARQVSEVATARFTSSQP